MHRLPANITQSQSPLKKALLIVLPLAVWCVFLWRVINVFAPHTMLGVFSSDAAIPVLMANDDKPITAFNWYYYGAGRWGGWPFLVAQLVRHTTHYRWSDQSLFIMQVFWVFLAVIVISGLSRDDRFPVCLVYLATICLHGAVSHRLSEMSQVYAWQVTALLLAWYCLRHFLTYPQEDLKRSSLPRLIAWGLLVYWFTLLSIWSSSASTPILLFIFGLEVLRAHLRTRRDSASRLPRRYLLGLILMLGAAGTELWMRKIYHRFNLRHYGFEYKWGVKLDVRFLTQNLERQVRNLVEYSWWPYYLLAALAFLVISCAFAYLSAKKRKDSLAKFRELFLDDTVILIVGSFGIALINFVMIVLADHVRLNDYDDRFMTLTYLFGSISGLLVLFWTLKLIKNYSALGKYLRAAFILAGLIILAVRFPPQTHSPIYKTFKETATALAQKAPRAVLMGGYWETYVFSALQSENALTPLPLEGQQDRMPWTRDILHRTTEVVVEYRHGNFWTPESLPPTLSEYGNTLRLADPKWYENGQYAFALYLNETK